MNGCGRAREIAAGSEWPWLPARMCLYLRVRASVYFDAAARRASDFARGVIDFKRMELCCGLKVVERCNGEWSFC